jgi:hypothetical protein
MTQVRSDAIIGDSRQHLPACLSPQPKVRRRLFNFVSHVYCNAYFQGEFGPINLQRMTLQNQLLRELSPKLRELSSYGTLFTSDNVLGISFFLSDIV